ncbi:alpha/beta fold hydrolase [Nonomuraea sp. NPDC050536]|uniref:alpha/beta fold hydrolase n=1 Tax=Nonomuraea sp. NPDC050536 TaxID=3364366 RepID=UPI0037CA2348
MNTLTSKDGVTIAYDRTGSGPAVIVISGAFCDHHHGAGLAEYLADRFTVYTYDRRGRGQSSDSPDTGLAPAEHEIDDLDALIAEAGGSAMVFTHSSGAHVALKALGRGSAITRLVMYDPPLTPDHQGRTEPPELKQRLEEMIADGRRGEAVETFQREWIGLPVELIEQVRHAPFRAGLEAIAGTLPYEVAIVGTHTDLSAVHVPALVLLGGDNAPVLHDAARVVVDGVAGARLQLLEGQNHDLVPEVTGPAVAAFLG